MDWRFFVGWLGLDWGNVPGWFSAGSFMAAGYVIVRDRQQKRRQQIDSVGVWGEFDLCQDENAVNFGFIVPRIYVKNASSLPVYVESVEYEAIYSWSQMAHAGYFMFPFEGGVAGFEGRVRDVVVPPGREVMTYGVDRRPVGKPEGAGGDASVTSRAPGSKIIITEIVLVDNTQRRWKLVPRADRPGLASMATPHALSRLGSSFLSCVERLRRGAGSFRRKRR
ncbi:hypothetical protein [Amycolatopsis plumensis]|uniref:Uncharacterized protein n=1 Tax=Amycolatopsis plumensis TaxID=236508 RepID=A0ABV5TYN3_9PSEU